MKTLIKLSINPEKVLKNDELKRLKGGDWCGTCYIYECSTGNFVFDGPGCGQDQSWVNQTCNDLWNPSGSYCVCI